MMKKKAPAPALSRSSAPKQNRGYGGLVKAIAGLSAGMVDKVAAVANQALVLRNWMVGAWIVEVEQHGKDRAKYGERLLETLAQDLAVKGLKGLELRNLRNCRLLYNVFPQIRQTVSAEFKSLTSAGKLVKGGAAPPVPLNAEEVLRFSWSQLQELIRIEDPWKRAFYENECLRGRWSVRQLQRQIESLLYERTGLSKNIKSVVARAGKQSPRENIADLLRDPYILEFAGLAERPEYSEEEMEEGLLDHLQRFLLELGRGFCFEARQFRMTEGRKHHRVDLVFYHRILRCHVLIDLKIRGFRPADAGQMNFYVNWFKAHMMAKGDNPPVGILLCSDKDGAEVEFATAGMDHTLFVTRYLTALPSVESLKTFLERDTSQIRALARGGK